jgi:tyrosine-specific transport protein
MKQKSAALRARQTFIGSVVGVGIFGLPFVFAQAGFAIGLAHIVLAGVLYALVLTLYADVIVNTPGHSRLAGLAAKYLGHHWKPIATLLPFLNTWGAMLGYVILGGSFMRVLLTPIFGDGSAYSIVFALIASMLLIGGLGFVSMLESVFTWVFLALIAVFLVIVSPESDIQNLLYVEPSNWFLPFGTALFAFGGFAVMPELADMLSGEKHKLRGVIVSSIAVVAALYLLFAGVLVSVSGIDTTEDAVIGVGSIVGEWALYYGAVIGLISVITSFLALGVSIMDGLIYDYKVRYLSSWFIAAFVPLFVYLLGADSFIHVISYTGAIIGGLVALLVLRVYYKAKKHVCTPKRCYNMPSFIVFLLAGVFVVGILLTLFG